MKYLLSFFLLTFSYTLAFSQSDPLFVIFNSGDTLFAERALKYRDPAFGKPYLQLDGDEKIDLNEVVVYNVDDGYFKRFHGVGYNTGSTFYKRVVEGKRIEGYATEVTTYTPGMMGAHGMSTPGSWRQDTYSYYSKDGGGLTKMNLKNLQYDLADNPESLLKLEEVKKINNINTGLYIAGAAALIAGIVSTVGSEEEMAPPGESNVSISPLIFVGAVVLNIPWFTKNSKQKKMYEALELYNR